MIANNDYMYYFDGSSIHLIHKNRYDSLLKFNIPQSVKLYIYDRMNTDTKELRNGFYEIVNFIPYNENNPDTREFYHQPLLKWISYDTVTPLFMGRYKHETFVTYKEFLKNYSEHTKICAPKALSWRKLAKKRGYDYGKDKSMDWYESFDRFSRDFND